jgi:phosphatidylserine/phosphatidylglycerophosphate/cardiolipin synthase-like enzyme
MLTSPLAAPASLTWTHTVATDLPGPLRLAFPPSAPGTAGLAAVPLSHQPAVRGQGSSPTALRYPGSGRWRHAQTFGEPVHWIWGGAADVLRHGSLRTRLPLGNPVIALRFEDPLDAATEKGSKEGQERGDAIELDGTDMSTGDLTVIACTPGAPGLDTLSVLRYLADALDAEGVALGAPTWQSFVAALSGLDPPLRVLEPGGSPVAGRSIQIVGGAGHVTLAPEHLGDAIAALGVDRTSLAGGATLDVSSGGPVIASADGVMHPDGLVPISSASTRVAAATIEEWLAPQQSPALTRFTRGNTVLPFADGAATFADLFTELNRAVRAGPQGAFYVTGYSLQHDAVLGPEGDDTPHRTVAGLAEHMALAGGDPRFLALQMLQLDPSWVQTAETTGALIAMLLAGAGAAATAFQSDSAAGQASFFVHAQAIAAALFVGAASLGDILEGLELNRDSIDALTAIAGVEAHLDPVDADVDDNPRAVTSGEIAAAALEAQRRFNAFHQKIQVVRHDGGVHAYCGGIDLNANRTQTPTHAGRSPFHDVHARVDGPAAGELVTTFVERWRARSSTQLQLDQTGALDALPTTGEDVAQVARTYYRPTPGSGRGFTTFAPTGESTILETLIAAMGRARRYIYIEDQYLTPPPDFRDALASAAARVSGPLIIIVPENPDQPFGLPHRQQFIMDMRDAWGDRFKVGILRKRFSHTTTSRASASGRLWLAEDLVDTDDHVQLAPVPRVPSTPFWFSVGEEVVRAHSKVSGATTPEFVQLHVQRTEATRLFGHASGTARATHKKHAAVLAGSFPSIYVHSKLMLIDDAFASIGSANANRRGFYSDGECNVFALRESVTDGDNWIRDLRVSLWAEHLGVPFGYAAVALRDPAAGLGLFSRKFTVGSRFTPFDAQPPATDLTLSTDFTDTTSALGGAAMVATFAGAIGAALAGTEADDIFDTFVDPSSALEGL